VGSIFCRCVRRSLWMLGYACTRMVQIAINCYYSYDKQMLGACFQQTFAQFCGNEALLTSIEDVLPARPGEGAGFTVSFARVGSFACPRKKIRSDGNLPAPASSQFLHPVCAEDLVDDQYSRSIVL